MVKQDRPYTEQSLEEGRIRIFSSDTESSELKWHWDEKHRSIELLEPTDWLLQMDNELPKKIPNVFEIPAGAWHRVIKGEKILKIRIVEK